MASSGYVVADSDLTLENLMEILAETDKSYKFGTDPSKLKSNPTEKCISEGKGFASKIYSVTLETETESYSVILKVPSDFFMRSSLEELNSETHEFNDEQLVAEHKKNRDMIATIHNREVDFYEFAKKHLEAKHLLVKYFYGEHMIDAEKRKGLILMEDLSKKNLKEARTAGGLSKNQVLVITDVMTLIQARSVLHQEEVIEHFPICDVLINALSFYMFSCADMLRQKGLDWFTPEIAEKVKMYAQPENMKALLSADPKYGDFEVLVHGDLWEGNMLFEVQKKDKVQLLALLDWQGCHAGSYTTDLAVVMGVTMEPKERRACEKEILEYYMNSMNSLSDKFVLPYELTYDTVLKSYKHSLIYATLQMVLSVVTNPNDDIPEEEGETEGPLTRRLRCLIEDVEL